MPQKSAVQINRETIIRMLVKKLAIKQEAAQKPKQELSKLRG